MSDIKQPLQQTWAILNHLQAMVDQGIQSALSDLKRERANLEAAYHSESDLLSAGLSNPDSDYDGATAEDVAYDQSVSDVMSSLQATQERLVEASAHLRATLDTLYLHPTFSHTEAGATVMNARAEYRLAMLTPAPVEETAPTADDKE